MLVFFKRNPGLFFVNFRPITITVSISTISIQKSKCGVLGIRTPGRRMASADETTELWWPTIL